MECDTLFFCFLKPEDFYVALSLVLETSTMKLKYTFIVNETVRNFLRAKKAMPGMKFVFTIMAAGNFLFLVLSP